MGNPSASFSPTGGSGMCHHTRKSPNSQVILFLAPGYLNSLCKVKQLQHERLGATHPQRAQRRGQDAAEEAGDMGFPRGAKQLSLHHPHPAPEPSAWGHRGTGSPTPPRRGTGTRVCLLRVRRGAPFCATLVACFCCQKDKPNGPPQKKGSRGTVVSNTP